MKLEDDMHFARREVQLHDTNVREVVLPPDTTFSKKLANLNAVVSLCIAYYN